MNGIFTESIITPTESLKLTRLEEYYSLYTDHLQNRSVQAGHRNCNTPLAPLNFILNPFHKERYSSTSAKRGQFNSPRFPSNYPSDLNCIYMFHPEPNEQVRIVFDHFKVRRENDNDTGYEITFQYFSLQVSFSFEVGHMGLKCGTTTIPQKARLSARGYQEGVSQTYRSTTYEQTCTDGPKTRDLPGVPLD